MSRATVLAGASKAATAYLLLMVSTALVFPSMALAQDATPAPLELRMQAYSLFPGSTADKAKAIELFKQAAEAGDGESMAFLGSIYLSGDGVPADRAEAITWYLKAAQTGHAGSIAKLAELATAPTTPAPATVAPTEAEPAQQTAAPAVGKSTESPPAAVDGAALREQALLLIQRGEAEEGFGVMLEAAEKGDVPAMTSTGLAYLNGAGTTRNKLSASEWLERAADGGDIVAMIRFAELMMVGGIGLPKDEAVADASMRDARVAIEQLDFRTDTDRLLDLADYLARNATLDQQEYGAGLLRRLAATGSVDAMLKLAETTYGAEHITWLRQAAEAGNAVAMRRLSQAYTSGSGVTADADVARDWMARSAAAGDQAAVSLLAAADERAASDEANIGDRVQAAIDLYVEGDLTSAQEAEVRETFEAGVALEHLESFYWLADILLEGSEAEAQQGLAMMMDYVSRGGDEYGMNAIGRAFEDGIGTDVDLQQALEWYERAKENGYDAADNIARVNAAMNAPPLPSTTQAPTDRWGPFALDGGHAVGIRSGEAYFAFGCLSGSLYLEYYPAIELHADLQALDNIWMVIKAGSVMHAVKMEVTDGAFFTFDEEATKNWMDAASAANTVELGFSDDINNFESYNYYHAKEFTARGSTAAIRDLRAICSGTAG